MAKKRRVFFWTKLETDMWHDKKIKRLRRADHGAEYILIYLMLTTETANSGFTYVYEGLDDDIEAEIALAIDADEDMVRDAIAWYVRLGMAELSEDRQKLTLYADRVGISVGSETNFARDKRDQRDQQKDKREDNVLPGADNVLPREDNVLPEGRKCLTEKEKSKSKSRVDVNEPEKPSFPDDDDDLPFANISDEERIKQGQVQVAAEWNRITGILKKEGIHASSLVLSQMKETSDRTRKLRLTIRDYGADVIIKCLQAYERDDWWTGRTTDPRYAGKARDIVYVLDNFEKLVRLADEMGLIEAADAAGGLRYRPADTSPVQIQQTAEEPKEKPLLSLCPKGYTGPRVIVNGIERPA